LDSDQPTVKDQRACLGLVRPRFLLLTSDPQLTDASPHYGIRKLSRISVAR